MLGLWSSPPPPPPHLDKMSKPMHLSSSKSPKYWTWVNPQFGENVAVYNFFLLQQIGQLGKKLAIILFFYASGNKNIGANIHIGREIRCLPHARLLGKTPAPSLDSVQTEDFHFEALTNWLGIFADSAHRAHSVSMLQSPFVCVCVSVPLLSV